MEKWERIGDVILNLGLDLQLLIKIFKNKTLAESKDFK